MFKLLSRSNSSASQAARADALGATRQTFFEPLERRELLSATPLLARSGAAYAHNTTAIEYALHAPSRQVQAQTLATAHAATPAAQTTHTANASAHTTASPAVERVRAATASPVVTNRSERFGKAAVFASAAPITPNYAADDVLVRNLSSPAGKRMAVRAVVGHAADPASRAVSDTEPQSFAGRPPKALPGKPEAQQQRVLLIEDQDGTRRALTRLLQQRGYAVTAVSTLAEAMQQVQSRPDKIVTDLKLPDGDATTLLQYVHDAHLSIPITVTTGVNDPVALERVRALNPESVLSKPLNINELMKHVAGK